MISFLLIFCCFVWRKCFVRGQLKEFLIDNFAGSGITNYNGESIPATSAQVRATYIWGDSVGNLYISEYSRIRQITATFNIISTIIGPTGPNTATIGAGRIYGNSVGMIYFIDQRGSDNPVIRKFSPSPPYSLLTVIGITTGSAKTVDNLLGTQTRMTGYSFWVNSNADIIFSDSSNYRIRIWYYASSVVVTIIGTGSQGSTGDNGFATSAKIGDVSDITGDSLGNIYFADSQRIRKVDGNGIISNYWNQTSIIPSQLWADSLCSVYFTYGSNYRVGLLTPSSPAPVFSTFAGTGLIPFNGDNKAPTSTNFAGIYDIWGNTLGIIYLPDYFHYKFRAVQGQVVTTVIGNGISSYSGDNSTAINAQLNSPNKMWASSTGVIYILDNGNRCIRKVSTQGIITTYAGTGNASSIDDVRTLASFQALGAIWGDRYDNLYIGDSNYIRKINKTSNYVTRIAGGGTSVSNNIPALTANLKSITSIWVDSNSMNLFLVVPDNYKIYKIDLQTKILSFYVGGGSSSGDGVTPIQASLTSPQSIWLDSIGTTYLIDQCAIRTITNNIITTYAGSVTNCAYQLGALGPTSALFQYPPNLVGDSNGNIYVAESYRVRRISTTTGSVDVIIGNGNSAGTISSGLQVATSASISSYILVGVDSIGTVYISESVANWVRKTVTVDSPTGQPSRQPTAQPTKQPFARPTGQPSRQPSGQPSAQPSLQPTVQPTAQPSSVPISTPTVTPSSRPSALPSSQPLPTTQPSISPTSSPTKQPSSKPTRAPSSDPSSNPSSQPSDQPSAQPTSNPVTAPTGQPSRQPTIQPSCEPTSQPLSDPSSLPSCEPTSYPTMDPSSQPSSVPTTSPTSYPSIDPSGRPSSEPTSQPSSNPSSQPSCEPTSQPLSDPSSLPSCEPTSYPTMDPSSQPSSVPTTSPTSYPSIDPSGRPSSEPTSQPSSNPSSQPSCEPASQPSSIPSKHPSSKPTLQPSSSPSSFRPLQTSSIPSLLSFSPIASSTDHPNSLIPTPHQHQSSVCPSLMPISSTTRPSFSPSISSSSSSSSSFALFTSSINDSSWKVSLFLFGTYSSPYRSSNVLNITSSLNSPSFVVLGSRSLSSLLPFSLNINVSCVYSFYCHYPVAEISTSYRRDEASRSAVIPGDVNGDTLNDLIVCSPLSSSCNLFFGEKDQGLKHVTVGVTIYGPSSSTPSSQPLSTFFGFAVAAAEDLNEDGMADIMMSALTGRACFIIYGRRSWPTVIRVSELRPVDGYKIVADSSTTLTGISVAGLGDVNGDSLNDLAISLQRGGLFMVYVIYGEGSRTANDVNLSDVNNGGKGFRIIGEMGYYTGLSISSIGDVNKDGLSDLVIGAIPYPDRTKSQEQKSFVIFGSPSKSLSNIVLGSASASDVLTIVGGGFVVSGPGDVNGDGIEDFMITEVRDYVNKGNAYIISYPSRMSSPPSFHPSSFPSSTPSSYPSASSSSPLSSNSSKAPQHPPTHRPSKSSLIPTIINTRTPTRRPTVTVTAIITRTPSLCPSQKPFVAPSVLPTRSHSSLPAYFSPSVSTSPIQHPRFPSVYPFAQPAFISDYRLRLVNSSSLNIVYGVEEANERFEISSISVDGKRYSGWSGTIIGGSGKKVYVISSKDPFQPVNRMILQDFDSMKDVIDLSHFSQIASKAYLSYLTNPLTLFLPDNQKIVISSYKTMNQLSDENFIFGSSSLSESSSSVNQEDLYVVFGLLGSFVLIVLFLTQFSRESEEKNEKMKEEGSLDQFKREAEDGLEPLDSIDKDVVDNLNSSDFGEVFSDRKDEDEDEDSFLAFAINLMNRTRLYGQENDKEEEEEDTESLADLSWFHFLSDGDDEENQLALAIESLGSNSEDN